MKILVINPNSDSVMTDTIRRTAEDFAGGRFEVRCVLNDDAPVFIETYEDIAAAAPGMIRILRENSDLYDAFVLACHDDPNLEILKETVKKPVIGIGEASMQTAAMLGHSFSLVMPSKHAVPFHEELAKKYHLQDLAVSVKGPEKTDYSTDEEMYFETAQKAIREDSAEVIVLGCAGLSGLDKKLGKRLGVPVIDGVACALFIAEGLAHYGVSAKKSADKVRKK